MHTTKVSGVSLLLAFALLSPIATHAQTTVTTRNSNFEVIAVDGNKLVVRDQNGTRELTVPPDFRFTVDGKSMAVSDLHAGMKGTATITNTTTERPVFVTTVKKGKVLDQTARTVVIKEDNGVVHRFTQTEADARGVSFSLEGKPAKIADFQRGDTVTATIVSSAPPETLTSQQVDAVLGAAEAPAAAAAAPADEGAAPAAATTAETPAAAPAAEPQSAMEQAAPEPAPAEEATAPALAKPYTKNPIFWLFVLIVVAALIWVLTRRKVKK